MGIVPPSRRDFVAMLLGAPAAMAIAGCRKSVRSEVTGELIDTGMGAGHTRIRDALATGPFVAAKTRQVNVAVIGAGAAGLSAAWALRKANIKDIAVFEHCSEIGGTARGQHSGELPHPWGAHYIVAPMKHQSELTELLADMGAIEGHASDGSPIVDEALRCRDPEERIYYRGRWYDGLYLFAGATKDDRSQFASFGRAIGEFSSYRDGETRGFALPIASGANPDHFKALDSLSFAQWLEQKKLTSQRIQWLADYACKDDFGLLAKDTSAWAGIFYFASRQQRTDAQSQPVVTWPDGNNTIIQHLAAGVAIEREHTAISIRQQSDGVAINFVTPTGNLTVIAQRVVCAVPQFVVRRLFPSDQLRPNDKLDYGAWAVANIYLRGRPVRRNNDAHASWDNVIYDSPSLGYVSATHQAGRDLGPTLWTWYYPFVDDGTKARKDISGASHADWVEVVLTDLEKAHRDIRDLVTRVDIAFWGHGMIRPRVGHVWQPDRLARATPLGNIFFAHTDLSSMSLFEEAYAHGRRAARELLASL